MKKPEDAFNEMMPIDVLAGSNAIYTEYGAL